MKRLKILSILLSMALALTAFSGCRKKAPPPSSAVIVQTATQATTEAPAPVITSEETEDTEETEEETEEETTTTTEEETERPTTTTEEETEEETTTTKKPTSTPAPTPSVKIGTHVKDEANVIKDDAALEAKLAAFEKATKIIPVVYTVKTDLKGDEFRAYTKNIYKNNFKDQNHFLIVYRVGKSGGGWSWTTPKCTKGMSPMCSSAMPTPTLPPSCRWRRS